MNRSLLIAICDFLVLSLLPLGVFKGEKDQSENLAKTQGQSSFGSAMFESIETLLSIQHEEIASAKSDSSTLQQDLDQLRESKEEMLSTIENISREKQKLEDLMYLEKEELFKKNSDLETSLERLRQSKEQSETKLDQTLKTLNTLSEHIKDKENTLSEMEKINQQTNQQLAQKMLSLSEKENEISLIASKKIEVEEENKILKEQLKNTEIKHTDIINEKKDIQKKLYTEQERMDQIARENAELLRNLNRKNEELKSLQENIHTLLQQMRQKEHSTLNLEKEVLVLKTKEANLQESLSQIESERDRLQNERSTLTESLIEVAKDSVELQKDIQSKQPLPLHEIYQKYLASVVTIHFNAKARHLLGAVTYDQTRQFPLLKMGDKTGVLFHYKQSFFDWSFIENEMLHFEIILKDELGQYEFSKVSALTHNPSLFFLEIPPSFLGSATPLVLSHEMTSHNQAALICKNGEHYAKFDIVLKSDTKAWALPESLFSKLFGAVHPRTGDPVLSMDGQFLSLLNEGLQFSLLPDITISEAFFVNEDFDHALHLQNMTHWKSRLKNLSMQDAPL